jgi:hypothetical protein
VILQGNCKNPNFAERTNETVTDSIIHHASSMLNARPNRQRTTDGDRRFAEASRGTPNDGYGSVCNDCGSPEAGNVDCL